jgi:NodT family efflux transporter outer membrane factor (OMF) lipoprotein
MSARKQTPAAMAALSALILAGCNLAPSYRRPETAATGAYQEAAAQAQDGIWKPASPGDDRIRANWWEIYGDPQLNALEEQVRISNQSILAAEANFRAARAIVAETRAALFPIVTTDPSFSRERTSTTSHASAGASATTGAPSSSSTSGPNPVDEYTAPLEASWEIDLWGRVRNETASSAYSAEASAADVVNALLSTQAELAEDYFEVRALDAESAIYGDTIDSYRQDLQLTETLFRTGIDSEEDVATAQTQLDTVLAEASDVGVARAQYQHAVAVLIGRSPAGFSLPNAPFNPVPPSIPIGVPSDLLERRPDIAAAERQVESANAEIGVARTAYFPSLTLNASAGYESSAFSQLFDWPSRFWSIGPQFGATLFEVGAQRAVNEQARAQYDAAVATYRQTVLNAFQGVEDNLDALRILSGEAVREHTAVAAAEHFLDLATSRYKAGIDSYLNVMAAQTTVLSNRQTELQVQLREINASVGLVLALGGGWDASDLPPMGKLAGRAKLDPVGGN